MNLFTFVVCGVLVSLIIWFLQRSRWKTWIRVLCAAVTLVALAIFIYVSSAPVTLGAEESWYKTSPYIEMVFFALMLAGMAARYVARAIEARRDKIAELAKQSSSFAKPKLEFDIWEFSYPLLVSVVTYGALLTQLKERTLSTENAILSFQTGFFWQTILAAKQKS